MDPVNLVTMSIQQDVQRMNVIANNSANALTSGFKREYLAASSQFDSQLGLSSAGSIPTLPALRLLTDTQPGIPKQTGNALDIALQGNGYFELHTDKGGAYTRQGSFHLDDRGRLVSKEGFPVVGIGGDIYLSSPTPRIDKEGRIFEQDKQVAQIKVVSFDSSLKHIGGGLMIPFNDQGKLELQHPRLLQGQLESSNVDSTREMVRMMEVFRHFEASHKMLQAYDDIADKTLRNLGQF